MIPDYPSKRVGIPVYDRLAESTVDYHQLELGESLPIAENPEYLSRQLITYIGNKRALLGQIGKAVDKVKHRLGKQRLVTFDPFSGSGVVSRFLKANCELLISNDLEDYATLIARCYLSNKSSVDFATLKELVVSHVWNRRDRGDVIWFGHPGS